MPVQLLLDELRPLDIPLDEATLEAWMIQCERAEQGGALPKLLERLKSGLARSIADCLDPDLRPPTDAQMQYAMDIARDLGVALPSEVLRFRGSATEFIGRHAGAHQALRQRRSTVAKEDLP